MPTLDFAKVRKLITMKDVLEQIRYVPAFSVGEQVRGSCPLHESSSRKSRSFSAHLTKNAFQCFKCGAKGNHLDLWAAFTRQPLYEATLKLCNLCHVEIPGKGSGARNGDEEPVE